MSNNSKAKAYLKKKGVGDYQKHLFDKFGDLIAIPSVEFDSKEFIHEDNRPIIKERIEKIREEHGLGVAALVLHAQQFITGHIPLRINGLNLAVPTPMKEGANKEQFLNVAVRKYRGDLKILQKLGIVYKHADKANFISHETNGKTCFYCSCGEMNPREVVIDHSSDTLNDDYRLGFTFAPFGRPDQVVHFLAWSKPKGNGEVANMTLGPSTYSDLVQLVIEINTSIQEYFKKFPKISDAPIIDGVHNGLAGNTIYHNHYQFFSMENTVPVSSIKYCSIGVFGKVCLSRSSDWPLPVYRINAVPELNMQLGNAIGIAWKLSSDVKDLYRHGDYVPKAADYVPCRTQNLFITGKDGGKVGYFVPRDIRKVGAKEIVHKVEPKKNLAVMECIGAMIIDNDGVFREIEKKTAQERTDIAQSWLNDIAQDEKTFLKVLSRLMV